MKVALITDGFYGVFAPNGELEAVESTEGMADVAAENLSPKINGKSQVNRAVGPVTVIAGSVDAMMAACLADAVSIIADRMMRDRASSAEFEKVMKAEAFATKSVLPANYWHDAHRAKILSDIADRLAGALKGERR